MTTIGRHEKWLAKAIQVAQQSEERRWKLGAALVKSGRLLSIGWNHARNNPSYFHADQIKAGWASYHAEIDALSHCGNPEGATIYVARVTPTGTVAMAKPCQMCMRNLIDAGVKSIWFTAYHGKIGQIKL